MDSALFLALVWKSIEPNITCCHRAWQQYKLLLLTSIRLLLTLQKLFIPTRLSIWHSAIKLTVFFTFGTKRYKSIKPPQTFNFLTKFRGHGIETQKKFSAWLITWIKFEKNCEKRFRFQISRLFWKKNRSRIVFFWSDLISFLIFQFNYFFQKWRSKIFGQSF